MAENSTPNKKQKLDGDRSVRKFDECSEGWNNI